MPSESCTHDATESSAHFLSCSSRRTMAKIVAAMTPAIVTATEVPDLTRRRWVCPPTPGGQEEGTFSPNTLKLHSHSAGDGLKREEFPFSSMECIAKTSLYRAGNVRLASLPSLDAAASNSLRLVTASRMALLTPSS